MTPRTVEKIAVVIVVTVLGSALAVNVSGAPMALLLAALMVTVCAGMDLVLRGEARYHPTPDLFILPSALVVGGVLIISLLTSGTSIVVGLGVLGALLFAVFWAEFSSLNSSLHPASASAPSAASSKEDERSAGLGARRGQPDRRIAQLVLVAAGYIAAFVLFTAIYQTKTRSLLSAPAVVLTSFLLAIRQLRLVHEPGPAGDEPPAWPRTLMYAAAVALAAGEITWALNYWPLTGPLGGAMLLAAFYCLLGAFSHHLQGRLTGRLVVEYGAITAGCVALVTAAGLVRRGL